MKTVCSIATMHPITLRLPNTLLDDLDDEAEEYGYSNRSEYIRHLLQNRELLTEVVDPGDSDVSADLAHSLAEINGAIVDLSEQVDELETRVADVEAETHGETTDSDPFDALEEWIETDGPREEHAKEIFREAATILSNYGQLSRDELEGRLYEQYRDPYDSANSLWTATIGRNYKQAPGFHSPEYGVYAFGETQH